MNCHDDASLGAVRSSRRRMVIADRLQSTAQVGRRKTGAYILCRLSRLSGTAAARQENLGIRRFAADGQAAGANFGLVVRRALAEPPYDGPQQGGFGRTVGENRPLLSRACARLVAGSVAAGSAAGRSRLFQG